MKAALTVKKFSQTAEQCAELVKKELLKNGIEPISADDLEQADFSIVIGGDGTIIHAAKKAAFYSKPGARHKFRQSGIYGRCGERRV